VAVSNALAKISECIVKKNRSKEMAEKETPDVENASGSLGIWAVHDNLIKTSQDSERSVSCGIATELKQYLDQQNVPRNEEPLKYWYNVRMAFPNLYKLAISYLPIVGTSVPCERLFSKAGITLCEKRNRLSAKRLSSLLFLHSVDEKYWFGEDAN
jgi:hypothetical protein